MSVDYQSLVLATLTPGHDASDPPYQFYSCIEHLQLVFNTALSSHGGNGWLEK